MAVSNIVMTGIATFQFQDTGNTNAAIPIKLTSGTLFLVQVNNLSLASIVYVKLYDTAGAVVIGTTDNNWQFKIPASSSQVIVFGAGVAFASGLQVATVTGAAQNSTTAPATPPQINIVYS